MTAAQIKDLFRRLGLPEPSASRIENIRSSGRTITQVRDDLLAWGKKQGTAQHTNMLKSLVKSYFDSAQLNYDDARLTRIANEIISGQRPLDEVRTTISDLGNKAAQDRQTAGTTPPPDSAKGVLGGGQTIRVVRDGQATFYQIYQFPPGSGNFVSYQFDSLEQARAVLGTNFNFTNKTESWFQKQVLSEANISQVVGRSNQQWNTFIERIQTEAARNAGIRDPSLVGQMWSDPEMQRILAQATTGGWSAEQILAEQRRTKFWTEVLYPGITNFYGKTQNPEQAWMNYNQNVSDTLTRLGYQRDSDGTFNSTVKKMLDKGIDVVTFNTNAQIFERAQQNDIYRQQLSARAGRQITFNEWFNILAGTAPADLQRIAEEAALAFQAQTLGFDLSEEKLKKLQGAEVSEQRAAQAFQEVMQAVLALGEGGLSRGGLTRDEILSAAAGLEPGTGKNIAQVMAQVGKIARENALFDEDKLGFFTQFTSQGTPTRPGLQALAPERG